MGSSYLRIVKFVVLLYSLDLWLRLGRAAKCSAFMQATAIARESQRHLADDRSA